MYKYLFLFFILAGCVSEPTTSTSNKNLTIEALQKAAMKQYMESPVLALPMIEKLADRYAKNNDPASASATYFNIAAIYDKTLNEKEKALKFGEKSYENALLANDMTQQAKLLNHNGYLKGRLGNTKEAKKDIVDAIAKYKSLNDGSGMAAAQLNLARVFYLEGGHEESAHFLSKSTSHFKSTKDNQNLFYNNLFAISLFSKLQQPEAVKKLIGENKTLIPSINYTGDIKQEFEKLIAEIEK